MNSKKAKLDMKLITAAIIGIILLVIIFEIYAVLVPTAQEAGDKLNASNTCDAQAACIYNHTDQLCTNGTTQVSCGTATIPLSGLFAGNGVVFVIVMAALLIIVVVAYLKFKGSGK